MKGIYAGIGSRQTPADILSLMERIGCYLAHTCVLRSGGAVGADQAFERGASHSHLCEIFKANDATTEAIKLASDFHPAWHRCDDYARKLHGRNAMILLGRNLVDPVDIVICWTKDGKATGGTGLGLRIAEAFNIPIYNLFRPEHRAYFQESVTALRSGIS